MLDKSLTPNLLAAATALAGFLIGGDAGAVVLSVGLFALSGALTNWLAVYMLFERVPGLYGSGVILLHFEELKRGIVELVREELFGADKVERLFAASAARASEPGTTIAVAEGGATGAASGGAAEPGPVPGLDLGKLLDGIDIDGAFDQFVHTVQESSFGNLLGMVGGVAALEPLREPFGRRLRRFLEDAARSPRVQAIVTRQLTSEANRERFRARLEALLQARLDELTPDMVRDLMQRLIRRHLGWLVVWGAVFGGLIGLVAGLAGILGD